MRKHQNRGDQEEAEKLNAVLRESESNCKE